MLPQGKGLFVWQVPRCGGPQQIADQAALAGLGHVVVKVADGTLVYNGLWGDPTDYVTPLVQALRGAGIEVWGWQYVYGSNPTGEALVAHQRIRQYELDGWVIDAESQYKGKYGQAWQYMRALRQELPDLPMALCSYRFPSLHPELPWNEFRSSCNFDMPQMYWMLAHNSGAQLRRCAAEFEAMSPRLPLFPTGAAFREYGWQPTVAEVNEFMSVATVEMGLSGFNFWEWYDAFTLMPEVWQAISAYELEPGPPPEPAEWVAVNVDTLNLRNAPIVSTETFIGRTYRNKRWQVTDRVLDGQGRTWLRSGPTVHLAGWLTRRCNAPAFNATMFEARLSGTD